MANTNLNLTSLVKTDDEIRYEDFLKTYEYPRNDLYEYETFIINRNLDKTCEEDIRSGKGFILGPSHGDIKKDLYDENGIFSSKFGTTLKGMNIFMNKFRCKCGHYNSAIYNGLVCPKCKTVSKEIKDDFEFFAWIRINDYYIINPSMYFKLKNLIGADELDSIITLSGAKDQDGLDVDEPSNKKSPFIGIGLIEFRNRIHEILEYYVKKKKKKQDVYDDIIKNIDCVFTRSIPVFTTQLRPYLPEGDKLSYGDVNEIYTVMSKLVTELNKDNKLIKNNKNKKPVEILLHELQDEYLKLYDELIDNLKGKKGIVRTLFGGRYTFTARSVITAGIHLDIDCVALSYFACNKLLEQSIINILRKSYNISDYEAYNKWYMGNINIDPTIVKIINGIINNYKSKGFPGIPILLNRNPTLVYGGIQQMFVSEIIEGYNTKLPMAILELFNADFDGDAMNIMYIINNMFFVFANNVLNPRNAMCISRNNGLFNNMANHNRETIININSLIQMGRQVYTQEDINKIMSYIK